MKAMIVPNLRYIIRKTASPLVLPSSPGPCTQCILATVNGAILENGGFCHGPGSCFRRGAPTYSGYLPFSQNLVILPGGADYFFQFDGVACNRALGTKAI